MSNFKAGRDSNCAHWARPDWVGDSSLMWAHNTPGLVPPPWLWLPMVRPHARSERTGRAWAVWPESSQSHSPGQREPVEEGWTVRRHPKVKTSISAMSFGNAHRLMPPPPPPTLFSEVNTYFVSWQLLGKLPFASWPTHSAGVDEQMCVKLKTFSVWGKTKKTKLSNPFAFRKALCNTPHCKSRNGGTERDSAVFLLHSRKSRWAQNVSAAHIWCHKSLAVELTFFDHSCDIL